jgi:hypothetical protein
MIKPNEYLDRFKALALEVKKDFNTSSETANGDGTIVHYTLDILIKEQQVSSYVTLEKVAGKPLNRLIEVGVRLAYYPEQDKYHYLNVFCRKGDSYGSKNIKLTPERLDKWASKLEKLVKENI